MGVLHQCLGIVLAQPVDLQDRPLARLFGLQDGGADGAAPGVLGGNDQVAFGQAECLAQRERHAAVLRHRSDERDGRLDRPALHDRTFEIARHGVAQPAQDLGGRVALLLGVDHVALGEHRAAAGDARRATGGGHQAADLFHAILHAQGLLVQKRPGAGGAFAGAVVVQDAAVFQTYVLRTFAADFENRSHLGIEGADHAGDGLELVLEEEAEHLGDGPAAGAGDADAFDQVFRHHLVKLLQQVVGGLDRAAGDAPVIGKDERPAVELPEEEFGMRGAQRLEDRTISRFPQSSQLETDRPNVQANIDAHFTSSLTRAQPEVTSE